MDISTRKAPPIGDQVVLQNPFKNVWDRTGALACGSEPFWAPVGPHSKKMNRLVSS